jgi:hypothetical protein
LMHFNANAVFTTTAAMVRPTTNETCMLNNIGRPTRVHTNKSC